MGKKSKDKKRKFKYTKAEFKDIICSQCGLCNLKHNDPEFCYNEVYLEDPKTFIRVVFKNLLDVKRLVSDIPNVNPAFLSDSDIEYIFKMGFCKSNYCRNHRAVDIIDDCTYLSGCLNLFRKQVKTISDTNPIVSNYRKLNKKGYKVTKLIKKIKKTNTRYVPHPYPTFFCSKSMEEEVRRIVDGNCSEQQDTSKETT